jgi:TP901 family phage tail tape measure protein
MAAEYKGLYLRLGIEGDKLLKELEEVDVKLRGTQRELNTLQKSLKIEFDSGKFVKAQELAQRAVQESKQKVDSLKKALEKADKQGVSKTSREYKDLQKQLNEAELAAQRAGLKLKDINNIRLDKIKKELDDLHSKWEKAGNDLTNMGKKAAAGTAAAAAGLGYAAKAAIDYEQAFVGVAKTVDATDEELKVLNADLLEMSTKIPVSAESLAEIAASAGQLGIKTENILAFTRTIADLGVASNLSGEEGASMLAKFANITQMPQSDFDKLGSTIVHLGNKSATTEKDIAAMSLRLAGAGKQANMSEADILGYAAALSSVGIEAEAGGSAISKVFNQINVAVKTNSEDLKDYAAVAGMTASEFKKAFAKDAANAVALFIEGLSKAGDKGVVILENMEISETRMRDALLRTAGAGDLLRRSLNLSSQAWKENNALTIEAEKAYQSTANQIQLTKNEINKAAIEIGNILLPYIRDGISDIRDLAQWFANLDQNTQMLIIKLVGLAGSLSAILLSVGLLTKGITAAIGVYKTLTVAVTTYQAAVQAGATSTAAFNAALATNPAGLIAIGITALTVAIGGFIIASSNATDETSKLTDELKNIEEQYQSNIETIDKETAATEAQLSIVKDLIPELYELEAQLKSGTLTEDEATAAKKRMSEIVASLNKAMPDLALGIDEETNALSRNITEVYKAVDAYIALAKAKAAERYIDAASDKLIQATGKKMEAEEAIEKAKEKASYKGRTWGDAEEVIPKGASLPPISPYTPESKALEEAKKQVSEAEAEIEKAKKIAEQYKTEANKIFNELGIVAGRERTTNASSNVTTSSPSTGKTKDKNKDKEAREAEEQRKAQVKAYEDNIKEIERLDERRRRMKKEYGELSLVEELAGIREQAERYRGYTNEVLTIEYMTQEEKIKLHKEYTEKAEDLELEHYKFAKDLQEKIIKEHEEKVEEAKKIAQEEHDHAQKLIQEYLEDRKKGIEDVLNREKNAIQNALDAELDSIRKRISAQKELLQTKIDAINAEIQKRRELREDEEAEEKIQKIQKQIAATQMQIAFARDEDTIRQLNQQLIRQQNELAKAIQNKEDTEFYRSKQAEIDALRRQMKALEDMQAAQIAQSQQQAELAERRARAAATAQISAAERAAYNSAMTVYRQYYDTSTATTIYNQQKGTIILQGASISSAQIANILNKITK